MNSAWLQRLGKRIVRLFQNSASLFCVLILWETLVRLKVLDYRFFPAPTTVVGTLYALTASGELILHIQASLQRVFIGFAIGASLGLVIGLAMGWSRFAERIIDPLISVFYPLPKLALLPLILIIFGIGEASKVAIVAIAVFFSVVINTAAGVKNIEPVFLDAARNYGAKGLRMFIKVVIPASLPDIFTGLRLALGVALIVIIAAEFVASKLGLGYMIWLAWGTLTTTEMYAGLVVIGIFGLITTNVLLWLAKVLMPWSNGGDRAVVRKVARRRNVLLPFLQILKRLPRAILDPSRQYLFELPAEVVLPKPTSSLEGVSFQWIDEKNAESVRPWKGRSGVTQFHRNLNRGMIGIYAILQGEVIGFMWCAVKVEPNSLYCRHYPIEDGDALVKSTEVKPEHRRRGVATQLRYRLVMRIRELAPKLGIRRICGTALVQNTPMLKLVERQGSLRIQEFFQLRVTPYVFVRWIWDLDAENHHRRGPGRLSVKYKYPKFMSGPLLHRVLGQGIMKSDRVWQPKGEA